MPQRNNNLDTLLMTLEILKRIPRVGKISAPELREQLEEAGFARNLRTIQRQLDLLSEHFDIERDDRSRPYGYSWKRHSVGLALPTLNEQESILLTMAEQQLRHLLPARLMRSMDGFFDQARLKLHPKPGNHAARRWLDKVLVVSLYPRLLPPVLQTGVFENVSNALYSDHWLDLDYRNAAGRRTRKLVMPLGLAQQGARLLLACRFEGYQDDRSLALHRVIKAKDTGLSFERPKDFDLQRYDDDGRFGFGHGKTIELVFRLPIAAGLHLKESPVSEDQRVIERGDQYEIRATVVESLQLRWWLRGFGKQLEVIRPKGLLDEA